MTEVQAPETPDEKRTSFQDDEEDATQMPDENAEWVPLQTSQDHPQTSRQDAPRYETTSEEIAYVSLDTPSSLVSVFKDTLTAIYRPNPPAYTAVSSFHVQSFAPSNRTIVPCNHSCVWSIFEDTL